MDKQSAEASAARSPLLETALSETDGEETTSSVQKNLQELTFKHKAPAVEPKPPTNFFAPETQAKSDVNQATVEKLLLHVARGEQDEADALLKIKGNEQLLLHKGKVTDYSNRTFENITAFQVALWALDWHMWKMLRNYLSNEDAKTQLEELETQGTAHGKHFDFKPLNQALQTYVDNYNSWAAEQRQEHWCIVVGGAQTQVPAHVANEYCYPSRSFYPTPSFMEPLLPRSLTLCEDKQFFPQMVTSGNRLGSDFGIFKGYWDCRAINFTSYGCDYVLWNDCILDRDAMKALCEIRTEQLAELIRELAPIRQPGLSY